MQHDSHKIQPLHARIPTITNVGTDDDHDHDHDPDEHVNDEDPNINDDDDDDHEAGDATTTKNSKEEEQQKTVDVLIEFEGREKQLLETITKNSLLMFIIIIADISYVILFFVLFYEASFNQHIWFTTNFMLFVTAFCDLTSLALGFGFSQKYYKMFCIKCDSICGLLCHELAKKRVKNKVMDQRK